MANRLTISTEQFWNATTRNAYAGAKMYIYTAQSRTVNKTTWEEASETTANANPLVADANGLFGEIYGNGAHYVTIKSSDDSVTIATIDDLYPTQPVSSDGSSFIVVDNVTALKAVDVNEFNTSLLRGTTTVSDGGQGQFYYDSSSTATADDVDIITPTSGTGRWLRLPVSKKGIGFYTWGDVQGLEITNGTDSDHDIDIAVGSIMDDGEDYITYLESALTKEIDATFAVGSGGGFSSQSTLSASTWYKVYLISKTSNPYDSDVIIASSSSDALNDSAASTAGFDISRRIGYVYSNTGSNILNWENDVMEGGNKRRYMWDLSTWNTTLTTTTTGTSVIMVIPPKQVASFGYYIQEQNGAGTPVEIFGLLTETWQTNNAASATNCTVASQSGAAGAATTDTGGFGIIELRVDGSSKIRHRENALVNSLSIQTYYYYDDLTIDR